MAEFVDKPTKEHLFTDDVKMIADMLEDQWSLDRLDRPDKFGYEPEQMMTNPIAPERGGAVYVYFVNRRNMPASIDYAILQRETRLAIKVDCRYRETMFRWADEVYRILMANRRTGVARNHRYNLGGNTFLEILGDRQLTDLSGWYTTTIDIQLTSYATPIQSSGFGNDISKEIDDMTAGDAE